MTSFITHAFLPIDLRQTCRAETTRARLTSRVPSGLPRQTRLRKQAGPLGTSTDIIWTSRLCWIPASYEYFSQDDVRAERRWEKHRQKKAHGINEVGESRRRLMNESGAPHATSEVMNVTADRLEKPEDKNRPLNGGFTVLELPSRDEAVAWAARIAKAFRCDQELRVFGFDPAS
jgi:hypothetical protein